MLPERTERPMTERRLRAVLVPVWYLFGVLGTYFGTCLGTMVPVLGASRPWWYLFWYLFVAVLVPVSR